VAGAWDAFCGVAVFDLLCLVTKLPLLGVMWRAYAFACIGLRIIANRQGHRGFYQELARPAALYRPAWLKTTFSGDDRPPGVVIHLSVDRPGPRWTGSCMEKLRDGNSGTDTRPDGYGYEDDFLPTGDTRTRPESRRVRDEYFFPPDGYPILYYRYNSRL
jgi:hypothetical protein